MLIAISPKADFIFHHHLENSPLVCEDVSVQHIFGLEKKNVTKFCPACCKQAHFWARNKRDSVIRVESLWADAVCEYVRTMPRDGDIQFQNQTN